MPYLLLFLGSSVGSRLLAAPAGVSLVSAGRHLLGRPLPQHLVEVEAPPVADEERANLNGEKRRER